MTRPLFSVVSTTESLTLSKNAATALAELIELAVVGQKPSAVFDELSLVSFIIRNELRGKK